MSTFIKDISNLSDGQKKLIDDLTLNKLATRKVLKLRQRECRAKIIEKTRNILDPSNDEETLASQAEHQIKQEIKKYKRRSIKLNENQRQNETNKMISKINSCTKQQKINQNSKLSSSSSILSSTSSSSSTKNDEKHKKEVQQQQKPNFRVTKISYNDKHLYEQPTANNINNKSKSNNEVS